MPEFARSPRPGFTIIESMVAITLFAVGLLGMAATAVAIQRLSSAAAVRAEVASIGSSRLEELRGTDCAARSSGTAVTRGITERWTVVVAPGVTLASDSLVIPAGVDGVTRGFRFTAAFPC